MSNGFNLFYVLVLGLVAIYTGEIVTFVMLGFILLALVNINTTLIKIYQLNKKKQSGD